MPPGRRKRQAAGSEPTGVLIKLKKNKADIAHSNDTMPNFPVKPTIRLSYSLAPGLQTHVLFIFVGLQRDLFTVHTALLPEKTRAILDERAQQQRIYLVEGNNAIHETFEIYRLFLYTGKLFSHHADSDQDHADNGDTEIHEDREWMRLAHAYLLGLDLRDERFCNAVVEGIIEKVTESDRYPTGLATEVYDQTDRNDKLRLLIVDLHIWKGRGTGLCEPHDDSEGPREFVQHVLEGFAAAGSAVFNDETQMPWDVNICKYHSHEVTARCKKARAAGALKKRTAEGWR